jgi:hypothetical protein
VEELTVKFHRTSIREMKEQSSILYPLAMLLINSKGGSNSMVAFYSRNLSQII